MGNTSNNYVEQVSEALREMNISFTEKSASNGKRFKFSWKCSNIPTLDITIYAIESGVAQLYAYTPHHIPEENTLATLSVLNDLHNKHRFVTFFITKNGDICAQLDIHLYAADNFPDTLMELIRTFALVVDTGIADINKALRESADEAEPDFLFFRANLFEED